MLVILYYLKIENEIHFSFFYAVANSQILIVEIDKCPSNPFYSEIIIYKINCQNSNIHSVSK